MNPFISYLFQKPLFGICFLFSRIPFWVPLLALIFGADAQLMVLSLISVVLSRAYIDSEITFTDPLGKMYDYFITKPLMTVLKILLAAFVLFILYTYAELGEQLDKAIALIMAVYTVKTIFFASKSAGFWHVRGLKNYKLIRICGNLLIIFLWLSFFALPVSPAEKAMIGFTAMFVSALNFYKSNEGLI